MENPWTLFSGQSVIEYKKGVYNILKKTIESMADDEILYGDFEEWIQYYFDKYTIQLITIYLDNITRTLSDTVVKVRNGWYPYDNGPEFYERPGYEIKYKIPYSGDYHLLCLQPNTRMVDEYPVSDFVEAKEDECGSFCLCMKFAIQDLPKENDTAKAYVERHFNERFENYKTMIAQINQEITPFNSGLREMVEDLLNSRKNRAKHKNRLCNILNIPLKKNPDAPNIDPVPLKLIKKTYPKPPEIAQPPTEHCISDQNYEYILKVIHQCCTMMQATSKTSNRFEEEVLRDQILATLSTHYQNNVWGETFRREGKTDIFIPFDNNAAFIAECKIWHGTKGLEEAVEQLLSYSTWQDVKVAVIFFNKTTKDFLSIVKKIQHWIETKTIKHSKLQKNFWRCTIHEDKRNLDFEVAIGVYDFSIDS